MAIRTILCSLPNAIHDRAFDRGLMWIDNENRVRFVSRLREASGSDNALAWVVSFEGVKLRDPERGAQSPESEDATAHSNYSSCSQ